MKIRHLKKRAEFAEVLENGERRRGETLLLYSERRGERGLVGVGVIVSKAVAPLAIVRNFTRRAIYAFFRNEAENVPAGTRVVVRLTGKLRDKSRKQIGRAIRADLERLINKAKTTR